MSDLPKDGDRQYTKRGNPIEDLDSQIVRAECWGVLFNSREDEEKDFIRNVVGLIEKEYQRNGALRSHTVELNPAGDIHILKITGEDNFTFIQKQPSGNVRISYFRGKESNHALIVPGAGNVDHLFNMSNTVFPTYQQLTQIPDKDFVAISGTYLSTLIAFWTGKPATTDWEYNMVYQDQLPQRIGHRIFPDFVLQAQSRLKKEYPHLFQE